MHGGASITSLAWQRSERRPVDNSDTANNPASTGAVAADVLFEGQPALRIAPGASIVIPGQLKTPMQLTMMVLVPAQPNGEGAVAIGVSLEGEPKSNLQRDNTGQSQSAWQEIGPIEIAGPFFKVMVATSALADGAWPAATEPFYAAAITIGGQALDLQSIADVQSTSGAAPAAARSMDDPPPVDYFTSFEQSGASFFLSYIPWIYNRAIVSGAPVSQANVALSGIHSCKFWEDLFSTSSLETNNLAIPSNTSAASIAGWINPSASFVQVEAHIQIDGTDHTVLWSFANAEVGKWSYRNFTFTLPAGATTFYGWLRLKSHAGSGMSSNVFYLDDFMVDFLPAVPPQLDYVLVGDTGAKVYAIPSTAKGTSVTPAWTQTIGTGMVVAAPLVVNGIAYVAISGSVPRLAALNARTGTVIWSISLSASVRAQPLQYEQVILVATADGYLRAYNLSNGQLAWTVNVLNLTRGVQVNINGALLQDNVLYLTTNGGVGAVNVATQTVLWGAYQSLQFPYAPEVAGGIVYAGCTDKNLYALNSATGNLQFKFATNGIVYSQPQVIGGVVIFGSDDGNLYGLNGITGAQLWKLNFPNQAVRSFLLYANMLAVVGNAVKGALYVYTFSIQDQQTWNWTLAWQYALSNGSQADPVINGNTVYLTASDSNVYAFDLTRDGTPIFQFRPTQVAFAAPGIVPPPTGVDTSRRFDQTCWIGAHNAYANAADGWWYAQQSNTIIAQLNDGVRMLMLDIWICNNQVVYAHQGCSLAWLLMPFSSFIPFSDSLTDIKLWLDQNPSEIVTLILEQRTGNSALTQAAVTTAGIGGYVFNPVTDWNVQANGWPSLAWMIAHGKRLVVLSDWGKYSDYWLPGGDGFPYVWTYTVENDYGNKSMDGQCNARAGSQPIDKTSSPGIALFTQNYFMDVSLEYNELVDRVRFADINDANRIMGFVEGCNGLRGRLPNFLAVDFYELGNNGGPRLVVAEINNRLASKP